MTRRRRKLTIRSKKIVTSANEQNRIAYISGPASCRTPQTSVVGINGRCGPEAFAKASAVSAAG